MWGRRRAVWFTLVRLLLCVPMRDETERKHFGLAVRQFREERGLTQQALAKAARLNRTYLTGVETGTRNVTLQTMSRLADALGLAIAEFFREADDAKPALLPVRNCQCNMDGSPPRDGKPQDGETKNPAP